MKALATGRVDAETVVVADERQAQRLQAKGSVGDPITGGGLRLSRIEAAHAVHAGRLDVPGVAWTELAAGQEVAYFAYADLRDRGLIVRHVAPPGRAAGVPGPDARIGNPRQQAPRGDATAGQGHEAAGTAGTPDSTQAFLAWPRGTPATAPPWFRFHAASERDAASPEALLAWGLEAAVVGLVDEDGAVTHYRITAQQPSGDVRVPAAHLGAGILLDDRVVVPGAARGAGAWLGTVHGYDLVLSFTEAETLRRQGLLEVPELTMTGTRRQHHFTRTLPVYEALRAAGVVAKSGFRFGTHLRGYARDPATSHAEWLIQCAHPGDALHWSELSRAVRLAHGVRKTFLLAVTGPVRFVAIEWFRP